jgi:hypothetical protein
MLRSDLVPHTDFHRGYWYKSNLSDWYYFKESKRDFTITEKFRYDLVDEDILPLVKALHSHDIPTTPSCSGHDYPESYFKSLYEKIKIEEYLIKTIGLKLINIETFEEITFQDNLYSFIYSEDSFLSSIKDYSKYGILGIKGNFSYIDSISNLNMLTDGNITLFHAVKGNKKVWKELLSAFNSIWEH